MCIFWDHDGGQNKSPTSIQIFVGLDHCSNMATNFFTSNNFFADRTKDLQNTSLHSLVFSLSANVAFTMKLCFTDPALLSN